MIELKIYVNGGLQEDLSKFIRISNQDAVRFELSTTKTTATENDVNINCEMPIKPNIEGCVVESSLEYEMMVCSDDDDFSKTTTNGKLDIEKNTLFHDWFGNRVLCVYVDNKLLQTVTFNVTTTEERFYNIKRMMVYLMDNEDRILNICLSRSKEEKHTDNQTSSAESIINLAESIIEIFESQRHSLHNVLRHRLALVKETVNAQNRHNINPHDIIENLDQLHQGYSADSITLFNETYSLENIKRESHIDNYDLEENKILLGGLISMKQLLWVVALEVEKAHKKIKLSEKYNLNRTSKRMYGFGIEDLYTQLTIAGIQEKIDDLLFKIDELLRVFQKELNIRFDGFIPPRLSSFARQSNFYISLYECLNNWYDLGTPKVGGNAHLTKIESISKIYEVFTLYKLVDSLNKRGWLVDTQLGQLDIQLDNSNSIPSVIAFRKNNVSLMLYYEKKIFGYHPENTKHNEIVSLKHYNNSSEYNYYLPDFLVKRQDGHKVDYYILDAKYSHSEVLDKHNTLDALYQKYYCELAIYDGISNRLHKQGIVSVQAVLPFGNRGLSRWSEKMPQIIPEVSTLFLSQQQNELDKFINLLDL